MVPAFSVSRAAADNRKDAARRTPPTSMRPSSAALYFPHMRLERTYLGSWTQRTNLHLEEIYRFLKHGSGVDGRVTASLEALRRAFGEGRPVFHDARINLVTADYRGIDFSVTEDGIVLLALADGDAAAAADALRTFHHKTLTPALRHLFGTGAPLPHVIIGDDEGCLVAVVRDSETSEVDALFGAFGEEPYSQASSEGVRVFASPRLVLIDLGATSFSREEVDAFVRDLVFFRQFERQLNAYLRLHRTIWDRITAIREARTLKYADFPGVRGDILSFEKTLSIVKARLAQMDDILSTRRAGEEKGMARLLAGLGMFDFSSAQSSRRYVAHLWAMTIDFADGTLKLLETLYQENTQRELNALKFITLITALTSFFGMNIAFPWEDSWRLHEESALAVMASIVLVSFGVYYAFRSIIHNRHFVLKEERK